MTQTREVDRPGAPLHYPEFLKLAAGILIGLLALGYLPTLRSAGEEGVSAMVAGSGMSLVGSVAGTMPLLLSSSRTSVEIMPALMGSIVVRILAVLALTAAVAWSGMFAIRPLLVWVAISHAALLVADTRYARAQVRSKPSATKVGGGA